MARYPLSLRFLPDRWSLDVTETGSEPLTTAQLKAQIREDGSDEDTLIAAYGKAARRAVENMTSRAIVTQTRVLKMDRFPDGDMQFIELPGGKIQSVTSVSYKDADGATQTFTAYDTDFGTEGGTGRIHLTAAGEWPEVEDSPLPVTITYVAGYDPDGSPAIPVPEELLMAIRMVAADLFMNRETQMDDGYKPNPAVKMLVEPLRVWSFV